MGDQNLKELLDKLHEALEQADSVNAETLQAVRQLDEEIHRLTEGGADRVEYDNVLDEAKSVEARFAVEHPVASRFLREIIDALSKVGI